MRSRTLGCLAAAIAAIATPAVVASPAQATPLTATARVVAGTLAYTADPNQVNRVVVTRPVPAFYLVSDVVPIVAGPGCIRLVGRPTQVACFASLVRSIAVNVRDRNDAVANATATPSVLAGGTGDDVLVGGSGADRIDGSLGNDRIDGRAGNDVETGGPGNDRMLGGLGNDRIFGEAGFDLIDGGPGFDLCSVGLGGGLTVNCP